MLPRPESPRSLSRVVVKPTMHGRTRASSHQDRPMRKTTQQLLAAAATLLFAVAAVAAEKPPFPRLAGVNNGGPHNYDDPAYQAKLAKLNFSVLNIWTGWDTTYGMTMEQVVRNIKAINPDSKIFLYENSMEVADENAAAETVFRKVDQMKWWAFPRGTDGVALL